MIPESKKAAVTQALQAAFGVSWFDDISELTAGLSSALVYRIVVSELLHMFYAGFLLAVSGEVAPLDVDATYPRFRQLHDRLWLGEINLSSNTEKQEYAWVHLAQFRHDMYTKQLEDALTIVSGYMP